MPTVPVMVPGSEGTCFTSIYLFIHLLMHLFSTISERLINLSSGDKLSPLELVVREADTEHRINTKHGGCTQRLWVHRVLWIPSKTPGQQLSGAKELSGLPVLPPQLAPPASSLAAHPWVPCGGSAWSVVCHTVPWSGEAKGCCGHSQFYPWLKTTTSSFLLPTRVYAHCGLWGGLALPQ